MEKKANRNRILSILRMMISSASFKQELHLQRVMLVPEIAERVASSGRQRVGSSRSLSTIVTFCRIRGLADGGGFG